MIEIDLATRRNRVWLADAPPLVADACDDEFNSQAAFDAKWSESDPANYVSRSVANGRLTLSGTGAVASAWARFYQPVPASEFVVYTKCSLQCLNTNYTTIALFVAGDLAADPSGADHQSIELEWSASLGYMHFRPWTAYNVPNNPATTSIQKAPTGVYLRLRVNGTSVAGEISTDGLGWFGLNTVTVGYTPLYMGLGFAKYDATIGYGHFDFFRCQRGAGVSARNASRLGREVALRVAS